MDRNFIYQHLSVLSAAKQRQRQQQQQQSFSVADHMLQSQQQPALPARSNAISSGEKPDATMAIRKGQEVSSNNGGSNGKLPLPLALSSSTSTTVAPTTSAPVSSTISSTGGGNLAFSPERFDKLMLLRGGDSEPFDGVESEFSVSSADSSTLEDSAGDSGDETQPEQDQQQLLGKEPDVDQEQAVMTQPLEEIGSPAPPMVTSLK
uniref:Uncharacterized protein n=1 Tax=Anopheles culicifacies TaxID=139723 RepID=A0A182MSK4_9DIPT